MNSIFKISLFVFSALIIPTLTSCENKNAEKALPVSSAPSKSFAAQATPASVNAAPAKSPAPTLSAEMQAARETAQLAYQYVKDNPALAKLLVEKNAIYVNNQEVLNKKIAAISPRGQEVIEKESSLLKALIEKTQAIREKKGVGTEELVKQQTDIQKELSNTRKEKMELSRPIYKDPEIQTLLQNNTSSLKDINDQIAKLVAEIKSQKEAIGQ